MMNLMNRDLWRKKKSLLLVLAALLPALFFGYEFLAWSTVAAPKTAQGAPIAVVYDVVKKTQDYKELTYPSRVEAVVSTTITAEIDGTVKDIKKLIGEEVKQGQSMLVLQNNDPAFTYAPVAVRAPFKGVISQIHVSQLSKVNRGDKLVTLVQPGRVKMTAEVPAAELGYLKVFAEGNFSAESFNEAEPIEFFINAISPIVDPKTNTAPVELLFMTKKNAPKIGTVGYVKFHIPLSENIKVPESAVSYLDNDVVVRLVDDSGLVKKQKVEIASQSGSDLIVKSGLSGGEKLIVRAPRPLKEGEKVDATPLQKAE